MVKYTCHICSFITDKTTNYERHLKTKKHLRKLNEKNGILDSYPDIQPAVQPVVQPAVQPDVHPVHEFKPLSFIKKKRKKEKILLCKMCKQKFCHSQSYYRHIKYRCKMNPNVIKKCDQQNSEIEDLKKEIELLKQNSYINNITNNQNIENQNIQQNVQNINIHMISKNPLETLNLLYPNNPSIGDLLKFVEEEGITKSEAYEIDKVCKSQMDNEKTKFQFLASALNKVLNQAHKRMIQNKDNCCEEYIFNNDGSNRRIIVKGEDKWKYSGNKNILEDLIDKVSSSAVRKHKLGEVFRIPSKQERKSILKVICNENGWDQKKDNLIKEFNIESLKGNILDQ